MVTDRLWRETEKSPGQGLGLFSDSGPQASLRQRPRRRSTVGGEDTEACHNKIFDLFRIKRKSLQATKQTTTTTYTGRKNSD